MPNGTKTSEDGATKLRAVVGDEFCNRELAVLETAGILTGEVRGCTTGKLVRNLFI